ncbi:biotin/lipoyl-binding protein [Escherichia albertii]|nr:biotin/lipoyl-binding protein [Escherichia albertii]
MQLFRKGYIHSDTDNSVGGIQIPASFCTLFFSLITIIIIIMLLIFITFGKYTRKAHLIGIVVPTAGIVNVAPQFNGHVTNLAVKTGDKVTKGQLLYHMSGEHYNSEGLGTLSQLNISLQMQYSSLLTQKNLELRDNKQQQQTAQQRILLIQQQIKSAEQKLHLAKDQEKLFTTVVHRYQQLINQKYVSEIEYQQKKIEASVAKENVENQHQFLFELQNSLDITKNELAHLIIQEKSRDAELERQLHEIKKQQLELRSQESFTLTAPISGTVSAIRIKQGQSVKAFETVLTLIPEKSGLHIELYATSQNIGFLQVSQKVSLRFSAFPYQKFGVQYGYIREISPTTFSPSDLISTLPLTWKVNEGHYRIIVKPVNPYIIVYGRKEKLRPGMMLDGDVNVDTRYLWEWLTEPLWSLKGKL